MSKTFSIVLFFTISTAAMAQSKSHPPLRVPPGPLQRPLGKGPNLFVDPVRGDDQNDGSLAKPWKTLSVSLGKVKPGDTLVLRGGAYYEQTAIRLEGSAEKPITLRSYPGESAILDGGLREFFETPAKAWEPYPQGAPGEYRSTQRYPNLRNMMGSFGDSMVGLQTYYHAIDLRAAGEVIDFEDRDNPGKSDLKPIYCGPGIWYDATTGHIHTRLAHTHLPEVANYEGETDPRKLPLVIAPYRAVPLHIDGARHIRLEDLTLRGGGHDTVLMDQCHDIVFDNVTVWASSCGFHCFGVHKLKMTNCGIHGNVAPWSCRFDTSLRSRLGLRGFQRDLTRYNTHALIVPDGHREFSVYAFPLNDDWEISHCDFTDGHDGLYLGGVNVKFHHNLVENTQDDGIYLSPMYPRHLYLKSGAKIDMYHNIIRQVLTPLAFGGPEDTKDTVFFYRNLIDQRDKVFTSRPRWNNPASTFSMGHVMSDHGSPPWSAMNSYHNTVVVAEQSRSLHGGLAQGAKPERPRNVFNNIFLHGGALPFFKTHAGLDAISDGNLYYSTKLDAKKQAGFFDFYRKSAAFVESQKIYAPGFESHSLVVDPKFVRFDWKADARNDYHLQKDSPAINAGVEIPADWPDPIRASDMGKPDLGMIPLGGTLPHIGRGKAR